MKQSQYSRVIDICRTHGDKNPSLWTDALVMLSDENLTMQGPDTANLLENVLSNIEERDLLSPLAVQFILIYLGNSDHVQKSIRYRWYGKRYDYSSDRC